MTRWNRQTSEAHVAHPLPVDAGRVIDFAQQLGQKGHFLEQVDTGRGQRGINAFLDQYLDSMLMFGQGVGEIVVPCWRGT